MNKSDQIRCDLFIFQAKGDKFIINKPPKSLSKDLISYLKARKHITKLEEVLPSW